MSRFPDAVDNRPVKLAAVYAVFGMLWILSTDRLVVAVADDPGRVTFLQTIKGWLFVALSALLVYALVLAGQRDLRRTNERLDDALQQTSILDRILRHNLRNSCNVIQANAAMLDEGLSDEQERCLERIESHNETLIELGEKSRELRDIVLSEAPERQEIDLVATVESQVEAIATEYPNADIEVALPDSLRIRTDPRIGRAVYELLENAIEHNDSPTPGAEISAHEDGDRVTIEVADDGPGLPEIEREVLGQGIETQMSHSEGLGLWIARALVVRHGGEFSVSNDHPRGTTVQCTLPRDPDGGSLVSDLNGRP
jgi:signal transduction histidine kinase